MNLNEKLLADRHASQTELSKRATISRSPKGAHIKAVVFDLGSVVLGSPFGGISKFEKLHNLPHDYVNATIHFKGKSGAFQRMERGELQFDDFLKEFTSELRENDTFDFYASTYSKKKHLPSPTSEQRDTILSGVNTAQLFAMMLAETEAFDDQVLRCIFYLRGRKIKTAALTNNFTPMDGDKSEEHLRVLRPFFDVVVESSVEGLRKPDTRFFEICCGRLGVKPTECAFLDDIGANLKGAKSLGMNTFKVDVRDSSAAIRDLSRLLFADDSFLSYNSSTIDVPKVLEYDAGAMDGTIIVDCFGDPTHPLVVLLHGGGQTRFSWTKTCQLVSRSGFCCVAVDQKGHGESYFDRSELVGDQQTNYGFFNYAEDLDRLIDMLGAQDRKPFIVGASLGGMATLASNTGQSLAGGIVLVDVTPKLEIKGVARVLGFMKSTMERGFASIEEAAQIVASYQPHRPQAQQMKEAAHSQDTSSLFQGLKKNLRRIIVGDEERFTWHYDPQFIVERSHTDEQSPEQQAELNRGEAVLTYVARNVTCPTLLIRGKMTDMISEEGAQQLLEVIPHAELVDVQAGHMIAGDSNDVFTSELLKFLRAHRRDVVRVGPRTFSNLDEFDALYASKL